MSQKHRQESAIQELGGTRLTAAETPFHKALTRNIVLIILFVSLTPLLLVSGIILFEFHRAYHIKVNAHLAEVVGKHKQNIDHFLEEKLSNILFLAQSYPINRLADDSFLAARLADLRSAHAQVFTDLGVVDEHGFQTAYAGPFKLGKAHYGSAMWFLEAKDRPFFISDVFLGLRGHPHFIVAVRRQYEDKSWLIRATINFEAFNSLVENLRIGKTGTACIVNRQGEYQTRPPGNVSPNSKADPIHPFLSNPNFNDHRVLVEEIFSVDGVKRIYATAYLKKGEWLMIFRQDSADAFADLNRTQNIAILIITAGALVMVSVAVLLAKKTVSRIAVADTEKELLNRQMIEAGRLASIGELAAGVAHEINNPVAVMVEEAGWISDLLEDEKLENSETHDEIERSLQQIATQGKRCKRITHKLLSFARKTDPEAEEVDINALIEELVSLSAQRAKYAGVVLHTELMPDLPPVHVSQAEFQQVFLNLINNALDAMEKTGGRVEINTFSEKDHIHIRISDNGPGIPSANIKRIFDPFFTTKPVGKGTGLGLSICYGIIRKIGGDIQVESKVDEGTAFDIRIPRAVGINGKTA